MSKRVAIIADAVDHLGPGLAIKLAERNHNLVPGGAGETLLPALIERGRGGQILLCSSATAIKPYPNGFAYTATRAGALMMVRTAAQTAAPHGITINGLGTMFLNQPGFLDNSGCLDPEVLKRMCGNIPVGRLGEPEEAAHIAASLLEGESNFINGEFFSVSGGWTGA